MSQSSARLQIKPFHTEEYFHVLKLDQLSFAFEGQLLYKYKIFDDPEERVFQTANNTLFADFSRYYTTVIGISLYNEEDSSLENTLVGILENTFSPSPNARLLAKTLIVIISDGYEKLDQSTKNLLQSWGLYNETRIKNYLETLPPCSQDDLGFMFEGKLSYVRESNSQNSTSRKVIDVVFMTKNKNRKKLNSHLWLYKVFCPGFNPKYVVVR